MLSDVTHTVRNHRVFQKPLAKNSDGNEQLQEEVEGVRKDTPSKTAKMFVNKWRKAGLVVQAARTMCNGKPGKKFTYRWVKKDDVPKTPEVAELLRVMGICKDDFGYCEDQETQMLNITKEVLKNPGVLKKVGQAVKPPIRFFSIRDVCAQLPKSRASRKRDRAKNIIDALMHAGLLLAVKKTSKKNITALARKGTKYNGKPEIKLRYSWVKKNDVPKTPKVEKLLQIMRLSARDFEGEEVQDTQID